MNLHFLRMNNGQFLNSSIFLLILIKQRSNVDFQEEINQKKQEDDEDRQLVCSLPD